jgi:hypothetical protein
VTSTPLIKSIVGAPPPHIQRYAAKRRPFFSFFQRTLIAAIVPKESIFRVTMAMKASSISWGLVTLWTYPSANALLWFSRRIFELAETQFNAKCLKEIMGTIFHPTVYRSKQNIAQDS